MSNEKDKDLHRSNHSKFLKTVDEDLRALRRPVRTSKKPTRNTTIEVTEDVPVPLETEGEDERQQVATKPKKKVNTFPKTVKENLVIDFVKETLKRGCKSLIADFRGEKRGNDLTKMKVFLEQNSQGRNRYKDVGCLDNTRVELTLGPVSYIHANYVNGHRTPRKYICTQAPLNKTIPDFWYMVVQERCPVIVMLCNFKEQNVNKCAEYFPKSILQCQDVDGIKINTVKTQSLKMGLGVSLERREIDVIVPGKDVHRVIHYHWLDWPDRGVPAADSTPMEIVSRINSYSKLHQAPVIIHCSAGIGRTGCIVLIDQLVEILRSGEKWENDLLIYLRALRAQRNNSVQTEQQYLYIHQVILAWFFETCGAKRHYKKLYEKWKKFTDEYNKLVAGF